MSIDIRPHILDEAPKVLSVGRRCVHEGFGFAWLSGELPYLIDPSGMIIRLGVQNGAPCLQSGSTLSKATRPSCKRAIPSRVVIEDLPSIGIVLPPGLSLPTQPSDASNRYTFGSTSLNCHSTNLTSEQSRACESAMREPANIGCPRSNPPSLLSSTPLHRCHRLKR
jgi:hypothetical protein